jgi:hypothetical protein
MFSHTTGKLNLRSLVGNVLFLWLEKKRKGHLALRTEFYGTPEQSSLRPLKPGMSRENWDKGGSCSSVAHVQKSCTGPPTHSSPAFYTVGVMFLYNGLERSISEAGHFSVSSTSVNNERLFTSTAWCLGEGGSFLQL